MKSIHKTILISVAGITVGASLVTAAATIPISEVRIQTTFPTIAHNTGNQTARKVCNGAITTITVAQYHALGVKNAVALAKGCVAFLTDEYDTPTGLLEKGYYDSIRNVGDIPQFATTTQTLMQTL